VKDTLDDRPRRDPSDALFVRRGPWPAGPEPTRQGQLQYNRYIGVNADVVANLIDYDDLRFDGGNDQGIER
jgi:hypothetical protein